MLKMSAGYCLLIFQNTPNNFIHINKKGWSTQKPLYNCSMALSGAAFSLSALQSIYVYILYKTIWNSWEFNAIDQGECECARMNRLRKNQCPHFKPKASLA